MKAIKLVLTIALLSTLAISYGQINYFTLPVYNYVINFTPLNFLIIITSIVLLLNIFLKKKYFNNYIVMILSAITLLSFYEFYQYISNYFVYDSNNVPIKLIVNNKVCLIAIILIIIIIVLIIDIIISKYKQKKESH